MSKLSWGSLRFRLIGWYVLLLLFTLVVFSIYFFFQLRSLQQEQQDSKLLATFDRVKGSVDSGRSPNDLHFRRINYPDSLNQDVVRSNAFVILLTNEGVIADALGREINQLPANLPRVAGFSNFDSPNDGVLRVYSQPVTRGDGYAIGWLQAAQSVQDLNAASGNLFLPILLGTVLAVTLAIIGGLFLANQALRPIERVTHTAQTISTQDLSRRINYQGPDDEIGQLSKTIDQMLERLEGGFEKERRFISDASHELRTPLTALKGRIEVTLSRPRHEPEYQETLRDLSQQVDRLIRLSTSLLYLARLDQAPQGWQFEQLDLSDLLDSIVDSMQPVAELKQIELTATIAPNLEVQGNLDLLTRLILNLLDNALKYTPEAGKVRLVLDHSDNKVRLVLTDTGRGIAPEHLQHLFKRFYRAESDRASSSGGAGLGLSIAYEIARQHGATLNVFSQVGSGTTITLDMPATQGAKIRIFS